MSIQLSEKSNGTLLVIHVSRTLVKKDYDHSVSEFDWLVQQRRKLGVLFDMTGFHNSSVAALWEDTTFAMRHFSDIEPIPTSMYSRT